MLITKKHQAYFKTLSGNIHAAHKYLLFFVDDQLEAEYVSYLTQRSVAMFRLTSSFAIVWAAIVLIFYRIIDTWENRTMYYWFFIPIFYIVASIFTVGRLARSKKYRRFIELFYTFSHFVYVDCVISVACWVVYFQTQADYDFLRTLPYNYVRLDSQPVLSVTFACLFNRRLPFSLFSVALTVLIDTIFVMTFAGYNFSRVVEIRSPALFAAFLTVAVYVYQTEKTSRTAFLNEREFESWKLDAADIKLEKRLVDNGAQGKVYSGTWNNFKIAAKVIYVTSDGAISLPSVHVGNKYQDAGEKSGGDANSVTKLFSSLVSWFKSKNVSLKEERETVELQARIVDRFEKEIRVMISLRHPNIVTFMGACLDKPKMILVTEYCVNGSLFNLLVNPNHKNALSPSRKVYFAAGCAHGLQYLHSQNPPILHRDFKSLSVLVDANYNVKISGFGLSSFVNDIGASKENSDSRKAIAGTIPWVAPEVFLNHVHSDKSDIFSFAIVIWEIFMEKHPYLDELTSEPPVYDVPALVEAIVDKGYRPHLILQNCLESSDLFNLIRKCWERDIQLRPDWNEIITTLDCVRDEFMKRHFEHSSATPSPTLTAASGTNVDYFSEKKFVTKHSNFHSNLEKTKVSEDSQRSSDFSLVEKPHEGLYRSQRLPIRELRQPFKSSQLRQSE